ncbi:acetyl-CoA carboxylase biotin carboxylase subunit [Bacillus sp. FJAT-47783]|uniref:acetyl-CoA carboxylase biotin carboxylase subunit n=1 Tax=Bacillus sp. FJAT-47783 TaxID=2922712 RepID=UPI001FAC49D2|nr:acetyl-CoA carboxylase biotin carboxylase subunit [Bacillus sp. FJAT-47783]
MKKVLIANRGEIASRIIETCKKIGIETVAVYSDADASLTFVDEATYAYRIGESPVSKSYLQSETILNIAKKEQVDAIHPGYGFLSENDQFAKEVEKMGIRFIGPSADVIRLMGDKVEARKKMEEAGVPVIPGSVEGLETIEEAKALAEEIGYPVMLKASGGGGGIGMQKCQDSTELEKAFVTTKNRAKAYFGSDKVFIEKWISNARHVEIQLFGDQFGNVVHLFERDCSIQRRNQKVIEESPSPFISNETREMMCEAAVKAAKHVGYVNAGTIEFIVDEHEQFYFLEMNTRLQVEHRVTEMVTNIDLVEWQIRIARGEKLPQTQDEILSAGHAMEFRLYAEDPIRFLPSPGDIRVLQYPDQEDVIVDKAYKQGDKVTPYYDPLVAKIVVKGHDRSNTVQKAKAYLTKINIEGIKTNLPLFIELLEDDSFLKGDYTTNYLENRSIAQS